MRGSRFIAFICFATISLLTAVSVQSDTTAVARTIYLTNCNYIKQLSATSNYGTATTMLVGWYYDVPNELYAFERGILNTDSATTIDSISLDTIVNNLCDSARFYFYVTSETVESGESLLVWAIKQSYNETQSSWNNYQTGSAWNTSGCAGVGTDIYNMKVCSVYINATTYTGAKSGSIKQLGDSICADGAFAFGGIRIALNTASGTDADVLTIGSDDNTTEAYRPYIIVYYRKVTSGTRGLIHSPTGVGILHSPTQTGTRHGP